jgi:sn-glycerol 3-phosphate transport system ATP-binding protein
VVLLRNGRIEQVGSPEELYERPATAFTASFIGAPAMNVMANGDSLLGVRPEDIRLEAPGTRRENGLDAMVDSVEYLGADSLVAVTARDSSASSLAPGAVLVRVPGRSAARAGEAVQIAWDRNREHHFDVQTGGRK